MGFIDDLQAAKHAKPKRLACSIAVVLGSLADDEAAALTAALADEDITHAAISKVLSVVQLPKPEPTEEQQRIAALEEALAVLAADMLGGGA